MALHDEVTSCRATFIHSFIACLAISLLFKQQTVPSISLFQLTSHYFIVLEALHFRHNIHFFLFRLKSMSKFTVRHIMYYPNNRRWQYGILRWELRWKLWRKLFRIDRCTIHFVNHCRCCIPFLAHWRFIFVSQTLHPLVRTDAIRSFMAFLLLKTNPFKINILFLLWSFFISRRVSSPAYGC